MTDPVCGMEVEAETAAGAWEHGGVTYLFCSRDCLDRFRAGPERFVSVRPTRRGMEGDA